MTPGDRVRYTGPKTWMRGACGVIEDLYECGHSTYWVRFDNDRHQTRCAASELQRVPAVQPQQENAS